MSERIKGIIETFELPKRIEERVLLAASRDIEYLGLTTYDTQYQHIANLVERYQRPWQENTTLSLAAPVSENVRRTRYDVLGDNNFHQFEEDHIPGISLKTAVKLAGSFLADRQKALLIFLLNRVGDGGLNLTKDEIIADFLGLDLRISSLSQDIKTILSKHPERQIVRVNLDAESPQIVYGKRDYHGDPLAYLRRYQDFYDEVVDQGRWALERFDPGLYAALKSYTARINGKIVRQIELAIPDLKPAGRKEYNPEIQLRIVTAHESSNGNAHEAARNLPHAYKTILKYWRRGGLEIKIGGPRILSSEEERRIVDAHTVYNGSAYQAKKHLTFSHDTILRYWKKQGLPTLSKGESPARKLPGTISERILTAYDAYFGNAREVGRALGCSKTTVTRYWRKAGLEPRGHGTRNRYSAQLRTSVLDAYGFYYGNAELTAKNLGVSSTNVRKIWKDSGLIPRGKDGWPRGNLRRVA